MEILLPSRGQMTTKSQSQFLKRNLLCLSQVPNTNTQDYVRTNLTIISVLAVRENKVSIIWVPSPPYVHQYTFISQLEGNQKLHLYSSLVDIQGTHEVTNSENISNQLVNSQGNSFCASGWSFMFFMRLENNKFCLQSPHVYYGLADSAVVSLSALTFVSQCLKISLNSSHLLLIKTFQVLRKTCVGHVGNILWFPHRVFTVQMAPHKNVAVPCKALTCGGSARTRCLPSHPKPLRDPAAPAQNHHLSRPQTLQAEHTKKCKATTVLLFWHVVIMIYNSYFHIIIIIIIIFSTYCTYTRKIFWTSFFYRQKSEFSVTFLSLPYSAQLELFWLSGLFL